jgi:hypothetical protein
MTTTYAAHIVTDADQGYGDPEIVIMTDAADDGSADFIASYPLDGTVEPDAVLADSNWRTVGEPTEVDRGYTIVSVVPADALMLIGQATFSRGQADHEARRRQTAWETLVRDAMLDGGSAVAIAEVAGISRERVYQIKDGRR